MCDECERREREQYKAHIKQDMTVRELIEGMLASRGSITASAFHLVVDEETAETVRQAQTEQYEAQLTPEQAELADYDPAVVVPDLERRGYNREAQSEEDVAGWPVVICVTLGAHAKTLWRRLDDLNMEGQMLAVQANWQPQDEQLFDDQAFLDGLGIEMPGEADEGEEV